MELRVLKYFLMTAREENITKAAKNLHITQPTLSRQLMQLEEENWFGDTFERLNFAGTYNLLNNAATMVAENIGAALCFELGVHYDGLKFVPLSPKLETGSVIVWQKNQMLSEATKQFIEMLKEDIEI